MHEMYEIQIISISNYKAKLIQNMTQKFCPLREQQQYHNDDRTTPVSQ